jgi:hypothetical protein
MSSVLLAAIAGAAVALGFRSVVKLAGNYWSSRQPIGEYHCADDSGEQPIGLRHGRGGQVADDLAENGAAWAHTTTPTSNNNVHTVYGPYTNDLRSPGYIRVRFRISGVSFDASEKPVVLLDVNQILSDSPVGHLTLGHTIIPAKDLKRPYKWFDVICYTSGGGVYEYRARVMSDAFISTRHHIHFDVIRVYRWFPWWELIT